MARDRRMETCHNRYLTSSISISAMMIGLAALGGSAALADQPKQVAQATAPESSEAPSAESKSSQLEEVTVTARYQTENLQQTPISITALTADDLEKKGLQSLTDISKEVPNLKLDPNAAAFGNSASIFIRGVGTADFDFAFDPGVGVYIDGVYFGTLYGDQLDLSDVASVQVLRGPQGTLFGRNTEGGAILINTEQPKGDYSGYAQVGYGSYNHEQFKGAIDIPLIKDQLAMRVAVGVNNVDGYVNVLDYGCANPAGLAVTNAAIAGFNASPFGAIFGQSPLLKASTATAGCKVGELGGSDTDNYHGSLLWTPNSDLRVLLSGDLLDIRGEEPATTTTYINPTYPGSFGFLAAGYGPQFLSGNPYTTYIGFQDTKTGLSFPNVNNTFSWGFNGTVDYDTPWNVHIKDILAYRKYDATFSVWAGGSPIALDNDYNVVDHHQFSQEFQISGNLLDNKLSWVAGAYYYTAYSKYFATVDLPPFAFLFNQDDPILDHNTSGFLHTVYHVTDDFSIETGVRYSTEDKSYSFYRQNPLTGAPAFAGFPIHFGPFTSSSSRFDPKVEFDYHYTPDVMTYFSVATGFKGGGVNPRPADPAAVVTFKPEDLTSYELGAKTQWFDNRLRVNADVFAENYKQLQTPFVPAGSAGSIYVNTGHVMLYGTEFEIDATPIPGLQIDTSAGWLHSKVFSEGVAGDCANGAVVTLVSGNPVGCNLNGGLPGEKIAAIPAWKANAGIQYSYDVASIGGTVTPRFDWNYQGTEYFANQRPYVQAITPIAGTSTGLITATAVPVLGRQPGYSTFDARIAYDSEDGNWDAAFQVHNLTNKFYYVNGFGLLSSYGNLDETPSLPRTYFFSVKRIFQPPAASAAYTPPPAAVVTPAPAPVAAAPEAERSFQVFFDFDKSDITSAAAKVIQAAADAVKAGNVVKITVTGHTDTVGSAVYNQGLSERRAAAVKSTLVADGVAGGEITTIGVGKTGLLVPTADGVREPQNRRAEIVLQ